MTHEILHTARLVLRPLQPSDAPRIAQYVGEYDVARMVTSLPHPYPAQGAEGYILLKQAAASRGEGQDFAIELPGAGLIGVIGAHRKPSGAIEIGYWIGKPYWGCGYATEAARAAAAYAAPLSEGPVEAGHFLDNPASGRVLEKAGFAPTGAVIAKYSLARNARAQCRLMAYRG